MKRLLLLFSLAQPLLAADGLYTHSVTKEGKLVHQMVQEASGNMVVQDEWYKSPTNGIDAMVVTTRGVLKISGLETDGKLFIDQNYSALTWFSSGGEVSNYWTVPAGDVVIRGLYNQGNRMDAQGAYVHSFSWVFGTKPPVLTATHDKIAGQPVYDINVMVKAPAKTQFDVFEWSPGEPIAWKLLATAVKPLGDSTNIIYSRPLSNSPNASFFRARTVWPRQINLPKAGGPFQAVAGRPTFLPDHAPFEYQEDPNQPRSTGPPQPPKK